MATARKTVLPKNEERQEQECKQSMISVDNNGTVHALREGKAILVGDFDGVIDRIQVTVYNKEDAPEGYRTVIR